MISWQEKEKKVHRNEVEGDGVRGKPAAIVGRRAEGITLGRRARKV